MDEPPELSEIRHTELGIFDQPAQNHWAKA